MDMCGCVLQIQHASTSSYCSSQGACFLSMAYARQPGIPPSGSQRTTETDGVYFRIYAGGGGKNIPDLSHLISSHLISPSLIYICIYIYICVLVCINTATPQEEKTLPGWLAVPGFHLFYDDWHSPQFCWMLIRALLMFRAAPSSRFPSCSNWARPTIAFAIR